MFKQTIKKGIPTRILARRGIVIIVTIIFLAGTSKQIADVLMIRRSTGSAGTLHLRGRSGGRSADVWANGGWWWWITVIARVAPVMAALGLIRIGIRVVTGRRFQILQGFQ